MKKIVRLTESDLVRLVKRVIQEQPVPSTLGNKIKNYFASETDVFKRFFEMVRNLSLRDDFRGYRGPVTPQSQKLYLDIMDAVKNEDEKKLVNLFKSIKSFYDFGSLVSTFERNQEDITNVIQNALGYGFKEKITGQPIFREIVNHLEKIYPEQ